MIWIGLGVVAAGLLFWLWTIVSFLANPGYGGFDMSSASAFDLQWSKGAALVAIGVGVTTSSWPIGVASGLVAFFSTMLVKPVIQRRVRHEVSRPTEAGPKPPPLRPTSTAGSMGEINLTLWPAIFGVTGHALGSLLGFGWVGAIVGVVLGLATGIAMMPDPTYGVLASFAFVPVMIFAPAPVKIWLMAAVCLSAWVRMIPAAVAGRTRAKATRRRSEEIAVCASVDDLVRYLGDDHQEVFEVACNRLYALGLTHDELAGVILAHARTLDRSGSSDREKCCWLRDLVTPLTEAGTDARDALLELYTNLGWLRDAVGRYGADHENADLLVEGVLFDQPPWEDDAPLLEVTERRLSQGWSVDTMVDRLLDSDLEAGLALAERAFLAGSLSHDRLDPLGDERAGAVLRKAIGRGSDGDEDGSGPRWDDIIDGALARPTSLAFSLMAAVLRTEDDSYYIDVRVEQDLIRAEESHLSHRHEESDDAANLLDAARSRTAWLREHPDVIGQSYKLGVMRELEEALGE